MEKTGFIYIWYDRKRKMYYIGCHIGTEDDGYICSSNRMRKAYRRRSQDFKRRILKRNIKKRDILKEEFEWLKMIKNCELGKKYYNLKNHHFGCFTKEYIQKILTTNKGISLDLSQPMSKSHKGIPLSDETKQKLRIANLGKKLSEETKQKISDANKGKINSEEHRKNISKAKKGIPCLLKTKQKISNTLMGKKIPNRNSPKPFSEEHKRKMSESQILAHARKNFGSTLTQKRLPIKQWKQHHSASISTL